MKSKKYLHGKTTYKTYIKKTGHGFEIGLITGKKTLFLGNFIKSTEANTWYSKMNKEFELFSKRFWITKDAPHSFYQKFLSNHLYKLYYNYIDKLVVKHERVHLREFNKDIKRYRRLRKEWNSNDQLTIRKKVA